MMKTFTVRSFFVLGALVSTQALAWGGKGHSTVNRVAITMVANPEAKKFLDANSQQIIRFANTPDVKWKSGDSAAREKPMHWFEMDAYNSNRFGDDLPDFVFGKAREELGQDYINKYGLAMWRISDFYVQLVDALKKGNFKRAVQIAGVMGHYVGDMTQPMHASSDYDGQSINKPGIHKYYETTLVDRIDDNHLVDSVQKFAGERRSGFERSIGNDLDNAELQNVSWTEADDAYTALEGVLKRFDQSSPDDKWLEEDLKPRIGRASALLGKIWDVAFTVAGTSHLPSGNLGAQDPEWIPMGQR
jgi:hypothetical protein